MKSDKRPTKKTPAKTVSAKKSSPKKSSVKTVSVKQNARKQSSVKAAPAKKAVAKKVVPAKKAAAVKTTPKKAVNAKKTVAVKTKKTAPVKKTAAVKVTPKKAVTAKVQVKKTVPVKVPVQKKTSPKSLPVNMPQKKDSAPKPQVQRPAAPVHIPLTKADLKMFEEMLVRELVKLAGSIRSIEEASRTEAGRDNGGDLSSYAETGTDSFDLETALNIAGGESQRVMDIQDALQRIKNGTYGICEGSGKPIPRRRLEAFPAARYCVEYQEELEREQASQRNY